MSRVKRILAYVRYRKCKFCGRRDASVSPSADGTLACTDCAMEFLKFFGYNRAYRRAQARHR